MADSERLRTALVTGASRGIGRAVAVALANRGARVIGTSRTPGKVENRIEGVDYVRLDLADPTSVAQCAREVGSVDVLVNNAGQSQLGAAEEIPLEEYHRDFQVNLYGAIQLIQAFLPGMRERRDGTIINVGSMVGRFALPYQSAYTASKCALAGFSLSLRSEVAQHGIRVVVVEPNDIRTTIEPRMRVSKEPGYRKAMLSLKKVRDRRMADAAEPEIVAEKIVAILEEDSPSPFYVVGGLGPALVFLKRFFPEAAIEKLVRMTYDLE
jgi:NAD(P)-dependent dehydrogenase (short-subunit alcohol dehydrogenase family)